MQKTPFSLTVIAILASHAIIVANILAGAKTSPASHPSAASQPAPQSLQTALNQIDALPGDGDTFFTKLQPLAQELLREFPQPNDQAQIYNKLAVIYAQAGSAHDKQVIEYAQRALANLSSPVDRLRLYLYWGGAVQNKRVGNTDAQRRKAAKIFFKGLAEAEKLNLPKVAPDVPVVGKYDIFPSDPDYNRIVKEHAKAMEKWHRAMQIRKLMDEQSNLIAAMAWLYHDVPQPETELSELSKTAFANPDIATKTIAEIKEAMVTPNWILLQHRAHNATHPAAQNSPQ